LGDFFILLLKCLHDCGVPGIVLLHIVPFVYDKYEDVIDHHARKAADVASYHYKNMDTTVLSKIPRAPAKQKKMM
jgi:hypothetical protein